LASISGMDFDDVLNLLRLCTFSECQGGSA
jgi:hypothetical protein